MGKRGKPWTSSEIKLLGTMPDAKLAQAIGRTHRSVCIARGRRGIAAYGPYRRMSDEEIELLGTNTDKAIAEKLGRSEVGVRQARKARGIPAFRPRLPPNPSDLVVAWLRKRPRSSEEVAKKYGTWGRGVVRRAGGVYDRDTGLWRYAPASALDDEGVTSWLKERPRTMREAREHLGAGAKARLEQIGAVYSTASGVWRSK